MLSISCHIVTCTLLFQETVTGSIIVNSRGELNHQGITLLVEGAVTLQLSSKSVGLFEAFYNSLKVCVIYSIYNSFTAKSFKIEFSCYEVIPILPPPPQIKKDKLNQLSNFSAYHVTKLQP